MYQSQTMTNFMAKIINSIQSMQLLFLLPNNPDDITSLSADGNTLQIVILPEKGSVIDLLAWVPPTFPTNEEQPPPSKNSSRSTFGPPSSKRMHVYFCHKSIAVLEDNHIDGDKLSSNCCVCQ